MRGLRQMPRLPVPNHSAGGSCCSLKKFKMFEGHVGNDCEIRHIECQLQV